jgi:hypothetical protein
MKNALLALALLTTLAGAANAIDRKTSVKKAARKTKTECPTKAGCCPGMTNCAKKMAV